MSSLENNKEEYIQYNPDHNYKKSTIIVLNSDKPKATKDRHYVDNEKMYAALVERRRIIDETGIAPEITEYIGECFYGIADGLSKKYNFSSTKCAHLRDEFISEACLQMCIKIDNFDAKKYSNPFSFFTQCSYYKFLEIIGLEDEESYYKYKSLKNIFGNGEELDKDDLVQSDGDFIENFESNRDYMEDFIHNFENKKKKPKKEVGLSELELMMLEEDQ